MKRAKLLSLFLAGSLLFQTAGIDVLATAPSEPVPVETVEDTDSGISDQTAEEESEPKESTEEEGKSEQPTEEEENKDLTGEEEISEQPAEEEGKEPAEEEEESKDPVGEEGIPEQPSEEEEGKDFVEEGSESQDSISENTVSENTISENTLPENEVSIFSIFPGLGENYKFSSKQLEDKRVLASHVGDVVQIQSVETATIEDFQDADDEYVSGEVVYLAETEEEAEQVAAAFGGTLDSYSYDVAVISLPEKATVALAIAAAAEPEIKLPAVWPNYYQYLYSDTNKTVSPLDPADPGVDYQWQHDYIGTRYAWAAGYKGAGVKVAVIDTGLARNHEDLRANASEGKNFVGGAEGTPYDKDNQDHGTHVAGIIAADDNGLGGIGIAPDATVSGYCVFPADGGAATADVMRAIKAAVTNKYDIINMSLGNPSYSADYETVVKEAYESGVAIFAASGNDDTDGYNFPAAYDGTISVGAVDENSTRASFSCYGSNVALSFPGVNIYSTVPTGYDYMDGTSMACPAAAGTAAVILSAREDIKSKEGKARVDALLSAMKSSTTKCVNSGMGAGTTYLPGVLKLATDMTAPETPTITVVNETTYKRGTNKKDYITESLNVTLSSATAVGVDIYYATDGKTPAFKNGVITNADNEEPYQLGTEITLTGAKSKTIKAIAVNPISGMASKVVSQTVTLTPIPTGVTVTQADGVKKVVAGKSLKFTAAVTPSYAISNKVAWSVDNKAEAAGITVSNGTVKTKNTTAEGEYTVTATAVGSDGKTFNGTATPYKFSVIKTSAVTKVAFIDPGTNKAPVAKSIKTGDSKTADSDNQIIDLSKYLKVTTTDASNTKTDLIESSALAEVVWSSSNTKVATVSDGVITAVAPGKATIKAVSNDGANKSASYKVTVVQPVTGITITGSPKVAAGKGIALTATVTPANASNKKVEWSVGGDGKVKIGAANGKITTAKDARGTYTVTAIAADKLGAAKAETYEVTIVNEEITKIVLNEKKLTLFPPNTSAKQNMTATLQATVTGKKDGATQTLSEPLITWTSSAPSIAAVNKNGVITAKAPGKATITCVATDGSNKKATCAVTVTVPMSKLVIGPTDGNEGDIAVGKKVKMAAKYYSNYGAPTNKKVSWEIACGESALEDKVFIDKNGTVSAKSDITITKNSYVAVRAVAQDGSGVVSNTYILDIRPNYLTARLRYDSDLGSFVVEATTERVSPNDETVKWEWVSDYCTATLSAPKNCGLQKVRGRLVENGPIYAVYKPIPTKTSTNIELLNDRVLTSVLNRETQKMTLTVKLKDGSNLSAKLNLYAVYYYDKKTDRTYLFYYC